MARLVSQARGLGADNGQYFGLQVISRRLTYIILTSRIKTQSEYGLHLRMSAVCVSCAGLPRLFCRL